METADIALRVSIVSAAFSGLSMLAAVAGWRAAFANTRAVAEEAVTRERTKWCIDLIEDVRSMLTTDWSATVLESDSIQTLREAEYRVGILQDRLCDLFWVERCPGGRRLPEPLSDWLIKFRRAATTDLPDRERTRVNHADGSKLHPLPQQSNCYGDLNSAAAEFTGVIHRSAPPRTSWWDHFKNR